MIRHMRKMAIALAALGAFGLYGGPAAYAAAPTAGAAVGTGTITPGLGVSNNPTSVTFSGTAAGADVVGAYTCAIHFTGGSTGESLAGGTGTGTLTCNGSYVTPPPANAGSVAVSCGVTYTRDGTVVVVTGGCTGTASGPLTAACVFIPSGTTTYALACAFEI